MWFVCWWCTACERCHEKYGTSSEVCSAKPTASCSSRLSERAPWPHSCASTHNPIATVPVTAAYAIHSGRNAALSGISSPVAAQSAVHTADCATWPSDRSVSRLKQWLGTMRRNSDLDGMSEASTRSAWPARPLSIGGLSSGCCVGATGAMAAMRTAARRVAGSTGVAGVSVGARMAVALPR